MLGYVPPARKRILEVGCAEGGFLASIPNAEETWGIEPDPIAADIARTRLTKVIVGYFEDAENMLPQGYFDVIVCNDVIEHMTDHDRFFDSIKRFLAPDGVIIGSLPNIRYHQNLLELLILKDWHYRDAGVLDRTHLRFFTERSLRNTLIGHGYQIERIDRINPMMRWRWSKWDIFYFLAGHALILATFGYFSDIRYPQLSFRARATPV